MSILFGSERESEMDSYIPGMSEVLLSISGHIYQHVRRLREQCGVQTLGQTVTILKSKD